MLLDLRHMDAEQRLQSAVCIVGGGTAGLVIAMELEAAGVASLVLESGGLDVEEASRDLNRGFSAGEIDYQFGDGCRSRFLGGSSNCWGGFCRAFEPSDFERRPWVAHSGWPISHAEFQPYVQRAHQWLQLGPVNYDPAHWVSAIGRSDVQRFPLQGTGLMDAVSHFSPPVRFGRDYRHRLRNSRLITVVLHANVVRFDSTPEGDVLQSVLARSLNGRELSVSAERFVLAAGGIENPRLMLACSPQRPEGLANRNGLVGRYFMDHPRVQVGRLHMHGDWKRSKLYDIKFNYHHRHVSAGGTKVAAQIMPTPELRERLGLTNSVMWLCSVFPGEGTPQAEALFRAKQRSLGHRAWDESVLQDIRTVMAAPLTSLRFVGGRVVPRLSPAPYLDLACVAEPVPNPDSRVTLSERRDALGIPRAQVEWRMGEQEKHTIDTGHRLFSTFLQTSGVGRAELPPPLSGQPWPASLERQGTWHHMGTTRMHSSPRQGVVDANCRAHECKNLYLAGSSVFPTVGANYPTVNLVALAVRLSDHLARSFGRTGGAASRPEEPVAHPALSS